jgi:hypothetical protein
MSISLCGSCGHVHAADIDGSPSACRNDECDCLVWTEDPRVVAYRESTSRAIFSLENALAELRTARKELP